MADKFDPYRIWLGIPPAEQPPHHYRLLGIGLYEQDSEVIEGSADRQMAHVQTHLTGDHAAGAQRLLNELAAAKLTLLKADKKTEYDRLLRAKLASQSGVQTASRPAPAAKGPLAAAAVVRSSTSAVLPDANQEFAADYQSSSSRTRRPPAKKLHPAVYLAPVLLLVGILGGWLVMRSAPPPAGVQPRPKTIAGEYPAKQEPEPAPPTVRDATAPADTASIEQAVEFQPVNQVPVNEKDASAGWIDLMPLVDRGQAVHGKWQVVDGTLIGTPEGGEHSRFMLPIVPPKQYVLEAAVSCDDGGEVGFGLTSGTNRCVVVIDGWANSISTFQLIDGAAADQSATAHRGRVLTPQKLSLFTIAVRKAGVTVDCDGRRILTWQDGLSRLGSDYIFQTPDSRRLFLAGHVKPYRVFKLRLRSLDDEPEILVRQAGIAAINKTSANALPMDPPHSGPDRVSIPAGDSSHSAIRSRPIAGATTKPPDLAAQSRAASLIKDVYATEFASLKKPADRIALAEKLLGQAKTADAPAEKYALSLKARDLAREAGEPRTFLLALEFLDATFSVDISEIALPDVKALMRENLTAKARHELAEGLLLFAERARTKQQFEDTSNWLIAAQSASRKAGDPSLAKTIAARLVEINEIKQAAELIKAAEEALAKHPDDPMANLALGKIFCLKKNDWVRGLPLLRKSEDTSLKRLAAQELADPRTPADQAKLADGWYALGDAATGEEKTKLLLHSESWYRQALPSLTGLAKIKASRRLEEIAHLHPAEREKREPVADASASTNSPAAGQSLVARIQTAIKNQSYTPTRLLGSASGDKFAEVPAAGSVLIGFNYSTDDDDRVSSIQGIYRVGKKVIEGAVWGQVRGSNGRVVAKSGYAVAGVKVNGTFNVAGFEVIYMKIDGGILNPKTKYSSPWIGSSRNEGGPNTIGDNGQPVIGIVGFADYYLFGLGLVQLPAQ